MIDQRQQEILAELSRKWGGKESEVIYYGSADATPQFVRLVAAFCRAYGTDLLDRVLRTHSGETRTIREQVLAAVVWTSEQIRQNPLGLLGFKRSNLQFGHRFQILQDGATALIHLDGSLANSEAPIETIGLQGLAYDCLIYGIELVGEAAEESVETWQRQASNLAQGTMERFWSDELQYFHSVLDRDPHSDLPRVSDVLDAMPGELLETRIFETLEERDRRKCITGIVHMLFSPEFLTQAGVRTRGVSHAALLPYADYQGSQTCWGVINSILANGLRAQGFDELAREIARRHIDALRVSGELYEFLYVTPDGNVALDYAKPDDCSESQPTIVGTNRPQQEQAWTVSFVLRELLYLRPDVSAPDSKGWQVDVTRAVRANMESGGTRTPAGLPLNAAKYCVDTEKGIELERLVLSTT